LKGQELPYCDFCGRKGHTETACRVKKKAMASAKNDTKDRIAKWKKDKAKKSQAFAAAASTSKQEDSSSDEDEDEDDKDKKAFMKSFRASWKSSQKDKKAQNNKCKRSDNDNSESELRKSMHRRACVHERA
jgi:hypothetical protein